MNNNLLIAGMVAGGSIGAVGGFLTESERLEAQGESSIRQITGGIAHGVTTGAIGVAGVGVGAGSIAIASALGKVLKK